MEKSRLPDENKTAGSQAAAGPESPNALNGSSPVYRESRPVRLNLNTVRDNRCMCMFPDSAEIEYFKVLRTQIQQRTREKGWNTLMVTSALPGEGKTLTAVNLALTFAREYHQTVLLVDCDLRRQQVDRCLGLESEIGLIDYLLEDRPLRDLIVWPGIDKLTLITGGRNVLDTTEILNSRRMRDLVREMKARYDDRLILFSTCHRSWPAPMPSPSPPLWTAFFLWWNPAKRPLKTSTGPSTCCPGRKFWDLS